MRRGGSFKLFTRLTAPRFFSFLNSHAAEGEMNEEKSDKGANGSGGRVDTQDDRAMRQKTIRENMVCIS